VLSRCRERLDCKCTVRNRFRKSWTAFVLCGTDSGNVGMLMYCAEQMQGEAGLQMYYAEQIQEKVDG
jgi:hypothetical protein